MEILQRCSVTPGEISIEAKQQGQAISYLSQRSHWILGASLKRQNTCSLWLVFSKIIKKQRRSDIKMIVVKSWKRFCKCSFEYLKTEAPNFMAYKSSEFQIQILVYSCNERSLLEERTISQHLTAAYLTQRTGRSRAQKQGCQLCLRISQAFSFYQGQMFYFPARTSFWLYQGWVCPASN